jgi:hypothetical protein
MRHVLELQHRRNCRDAGEPLLTRRPNIAAGLEIVAWNKTNKFFERPLKQNVKYHFATGVATL